MCGCPGKIRDLQGATYRLLVRLFHLLRLWPVQLLQQALLARQLRHQRQPWRACGLRACFGSLCG